MPRPPYPTQSILEKCSQAYVNKMATKDKKFSNGIPDCYLEAARLGDINRNSPNLVHLVEIFIGGQALHVIGRQQNELDIYPVPVSVHEASPENPYYRQ